MLVTYCIQNLITRDRVDKEAIKQIIHRMDVYILIIEDISSRDAMQKVNE